MINWDRRKMYAHVYFNMPKDELGIAVYSIGRIPGFSGKLNKDLKDATGITNAYKLFEEVMGKKISKEELQAGKVFNYENVSKRIKVLDKLNKYHAGKDSNATVNLDDAKIWFQIAYEQLDSTRQLIAKGLPEDKQDRLGLNFRTREIKDLEAAIELGDKEQIENELRELYLYVSSNVGTMSTKEFEGQKLSPPTMIYSEDFGVAFYPGFRGARYMRPIPKGLALIHPRDETGAPTAPEDKWYHIIIPDTKIYTDNRPLNNIDIKDLNSTTEQLAKMFFKNLNQVAGFKDLTKGHFNQAISPVIELAKKLLGQMDSDNKKVASSEVGCWIDLQTGKIYDTEEAVVSAKTQERESPPEEEYALVAKRIQNLFLKLGHYDSYARIKEKHDNI